MRRAFRFCGASLAVFLGVLFAVGTISLLVSATKRLVKSSKSSKDHVLVVPLTGMIASSSALLKRVKDATENKGTKAIVLRINSPGGFVAPSQELYEGFRKLDEKIPVIVSMAQVAASGGYYVALAGRKIFANPGTMTASIGVVMEFANLQKLYQWAKMERFEITSGKYKRAGSDTRPMTKDERALFQAMIDDIQKQFRGTVQVRRGLSPEKLAAVTDGRVVTGSQAKDAELVDALGGLDDAIAEAKKVAKLPESAEVTYLEAPRGLIDQILDPNDQNADLSTFTEWMTELRSQSPTVSGWRAMLLSPIH